MELLLTSTFARQLKKLHKNEKDSLKLLLLGPHENFYRNLKKS